MARPPVCKLMDYGKFKYESAQKAREARRNQQLTVIKEMKLRPKIDPHDYETKKGHVVRFLEGGDKVKVTIMFRGREQSRPELGFRLLQRLAEDVGELGFVEATPKQDGRNMIMVIAPHRRSRQAKRQAPARTPRARAARPDRTPHGPTGTPSRTGCRQRRNCHAEEEDPHRDEQAGQGHRHAASSCASRPASATCLEDKSSRRRAASRGVVPVSKADVKRVKKLLGR